LGCGEHRVRGGSKAANKQVFVSSDLGNEGLAAFRAADDEQRPAKAAKWLNSQKHKELNKMLFFGGQ
jgi:hypothetical protein